MPNYRLTLCYDGTRWKGWQKQGNTDNTIQGKLETLLSRLLDQPVEVAGSGRTDGGTHARGQVASFRAKTDWTPQEILERVHPGKTARAVISWCLPNSQEARETNRRETERPSLHWARVRSFGDIASQNLRTSLCRWLAEHGVAAVAPFLHDDYHAAIRNLRSCWSERHVAFIAGLGTFGLSGGLITEHGIAHRLASVVVDLPLPADTRPYGDDILAWCTRCGACARRCPAGSIGASLAERDKTRCLRWAVDHIAPNRAETYGWMDLSLGCGLCQTNVPCEHKRP